jgi:hypothetical protein
VLDVGVAAELLLGTEDAIGMGNLVVVNLVLLEVGRVIQEALHFLPESIVEEGLVELHVAVHDALLE